MRSGVSLTVVPRVRTGDYRPVGEWRRRARAGRESDAIRLSSRDLAVLRWVSEQYAVRLDQLAVLLGLGVRSARRVAERLAAAGLVERRRFLVDEPLWLWVTPRGQ